MRRLILLSFLLVSFAASAHIDPRISCVMNLRLPLATHRSRPDEVSVEARMGGVVIFREPLPSVSCLTH